MNPWYAVTLIGTPELWAFICVGLVALYLALRSTLWKEQSRKRRQLKGIVILFVLAFSITFVVIYLLKLAFAIPRECIPCPAPGCNPYCLPDAGFPSGHAAAIFALFTSVLVVTRHRQGTLALLALAILVSVSRVALGVHAWADVVAGAALGVLVVIGVWRLEKQLKLGQITPKITKK
ncbi:MAG: phosphatase PAP2 family protein [Candidatus Aenigmatarchaeota archaeon]